MHELHGLTRRALTRCERIHPAELAAKLKEVAPDGIDMYFDNVGGIHFEAAMATLAPYGRVAVCGGISRYNEGERGFEKFHPTDMIYTFQRVEVRLVLLFLSYRV